MLSSSKSVSEWANQIDRDCPGSPKSDAFNYRGYGEPPYSPKATWIGLELQISNFTKHIERSESSNIVVVGYSLGGLIALVGAADLPEALQSRVEHVVLVAPAVKPSRVEVLKTSSRHTLDRGIPLPDSVLDICGPDPTWRRRAREAFRTLSSRSCKVSVVHSRLDKYCPVPVVPLEWSIEPLIRVVELWMETRDLDARAYHLAIKDCASAMYWICDLLAR